MTALSEIFSQLCTKAIVLLALLLIQLLLLIRKLKSDTRPITTTQYLKLIEQKNPTICFTKRLKPEHAECRVCLSEFQEGERVRNLKCKHTFHKDCLDKWLQQYWATCPLCRNQVLPDDVVAKYRQLQNQTRRRIMGKILKTVNALINCGAPLGKEKSRADIFFVGKSVEIFMKNAQLASGIEVTVYLLT